MISGSWKLVEWDRFALNGSGDTIADTNYNVEASADSLKQFIEFKNDSIYNWQYSDTCSWLAKNGFVLTGETHRPEIGELGYLFILNNEGIVDTFKLNVIDSFVAHQNWTTFTLINWTPNAVPSYG